MQVVSTAVVAKSELFKIKHQLLYLRNHLPEGTVKALASIALQFKRSLLERLKGGDPVGKVLPVVRMQDVIR